MTLATAELALAAETAEAKGVASNSAGVPVTVVSGCLTDIRLVIGSGFEASRCARTAIAPVEPNTTPRKPATKAWRPHDGSDSPSGLAFDCTRRSEVARRSIPGMAAYEKLLERLLETVIDMTLPLRKMNRPFLLDDIYAGYSYTAHAIKWMKFSDGPWCYGVTVVNNDPINGWYIGSNGNGGCGQNNHPNIDGMVANIYAWWWRNFGGSDNTYQAFSDELATYSLVAGFGAPKDWNQVMRFSFDYLRWRQGR